MKNLTKLLAPAFLTLSLLFFSCGEGGLNPQIPGLQGPNLYLDQEFIRVDAIFEKIEVQAGGRIGFPALGLEDYENSFLEIQPALEGGTLFAINLAILDVLGGYEGLELLDPQSLPDGRPLPGIVGGKMPAVAFSVEKLHDMAFYLNKDVFGIWYPLEKLDLGVNAIISARFYSDSKRVGNISLVGQNEEGTGAGVLLLLTLDSATKSLLKTYMKKVQ